MCRTKLLFHEIKMWNIFSTSMNLIVGRNQAGNVTDSKGLLVSGRGLLMGIHESEHANTMYCKQEQINR